MNKSRYSILIICEGDNTEPSFFNSICDKIINREYRLDAVIKILPEPKIESESESQSDLVEHRSKRKSRSLKKAIKEEPTIIKGVPPLKWVIAGIEELNSGTYNEVWTVFDHDDHPKREEAFKLAESTVIDGKRVKIAFTSRSFEYFLLLCFERIYRKFDKTDCKVDHKIINCGANDNMHDDDCLGDLCINGYARARGYWDNSKAKESMFPIVEDRLEVAFDNSAWLRNRSDSITKRDVIYNRNPYTDIDYLISRLTGIPVRVWIELDAEVDGVVIKREGSNSIIITNKTSKTLLLIENAFYGYNISENEKIIFGDRVLLVPNEPNLIDIPSKYITRFNYFGVKVNNKILLFSLE